MRWLITGGCGFIGRAFIASLTIEAGHRIRVLDNLTVGTKEELAAVAPIAEQPDDCADWSSPLSLWIADVTDPSTVLDACRGADAVVHLAANTGVPQSVDDPVSDCRTNVLGTLNVLEACRHHNVGRLVFASSGAPLGVQTPPLHEQLAPRPASPYGASKLAGEGYCSAYFHCFGVETVALRFGNVYGEGSAHKGSVVAKFITAALAGKPLEIYGDGAQTRDFVHISDLTRAIKLAAGTPGIGGETFQIATSRETTVTELVDVLVDALTAEGVSPPSVVNGEQRAGDVSRNFSDTRKASKRLGWNAEVPLSQGLRWTVRSFINLHNQRQRER
jgi:UDP-glucose 4-epimerase